MAYKTPRTKLMNKFLKCGLALLSGVWLCSQGALADDVRLYGTVNSTWGSYGSDVFDNNGEGIYSVNIGTSPRVQFVKAGPNSFGGGYYAQGIYYSSFYNETRDNITMPVRLYPYQATTWTADTVYRGFAFSTISQEMTWDPVTQSAYGCFYDNGLNQMQTLARVNLSTADPAWGALMTTDSIGQLPEKMVAMACNLNGQLYGIGLSGNFYAISKYTAKATLVGPTGLRVMNIRQSATADLTTGKLYWAAMTYDGDGYPMSSIYEVDPATGKATMAADLSDNGTGSGEQFLGLFIPQDLTLAARPEAVANLAAAATSTGGTVTFTMPSQDVNGSPLTGSLSYIIMVDTLNPIEGTANAGAEVSVPFTSDNSGQASIFVVAQVPATSASPAAASPVAQTTLWTGDGVPQAPTNVTATDDGSTVTITWTAPTGCVGQGTFNPADLYYTVTRFQRENATDSTVVADNLKATTFADATVPESNGTYYYKVVAHNGSLASAPAESNDITRSGGIALPYSNALNTQESIDGFTTIDANNDGSTWTFDANSGQLQYNYNSTNAADDWFISPAINMKKGAIYTFTFEALNTYPVERVEARVGSDATAEAMTTTVIEPTDITYTPRVHTLTGTFRATADGKQFFGIHAISDADRSTLFIRNLTITETPVTAPEGVTGLTVTPGDKGASQATITFNAPTTSLGGSSLTDSLSISISRDGQQVGKLSAWPGEACAYTDNAVPSGSHTYSVVAIGQDGYQSASETATAFVGIDVPGAVRNLKAVEDMDHEGLIHVTWDAPLTGVNGGYIDPAALTYYLSVGYERDDRNLGNSTSFDDQLTINGAQTYTGYTVYAVNGTGSGRDYRQTCTTVAGPAVVAPMIETFPQSTMKSGPWLTNVTNGEIGDAYCYAMGEYNGIIAQDADGGMQSFSAVRAGLSVRSESPKVDISRLKSPVLHFWARFNGTDDSLVVSVSPEYQGFQPVLRLSADKAAEGWQRYTVDLSLWKDTRFIQVGFEGKSVSTLDNFIDYDNVAIIDNANTDLMAMSLTTPERANTGSEATMQVVLRNNSAETAGNATVTLYKNGKAVKTVGVPETDVDMTTTVELTDTASVMDADTTSYFAVVSMDGDEVAANDTTNTRTMLVIKPDYPAPTGLTAIKEDNGVNLTWQEPDMLNRKGAATTDGFDSYTMFDISGFGDWTTIDQDGDSTIMITLSALFGPLQYNNAGKPMAYQVFNPEEVGITFNSWKPHSGNQMLVSFANASPDQGFSKGKQNDDWLVSPRLSGEEQTISFFAKAGMGGNYIPEQIEVLYSTTDAQPASFTKVGETIDINNVNEWQEFRFNVPQGATYFAIRHVSDYKFALLIDDITYIADGSQPVDLTLLGYNVYRDSVRLNSSLVTDRAFTDASAKAGLYQVTAIYDKGESVPCDAVAATTGIREINADGRTTADGTPLFNIAGQRVSSNYKGIVIQKGKKTIKK